MTRYILLRDSNRAWRRESRGVVCVIDAIPDPVLDIVDLGPNDLRLVAHDSDVLGFAPSMPTRGVAPIPLDDPRPEEARPGWGAKAIGLTQTHTQTHCETPIALLDTGLDAHHPAFAATRLVTQDFVGTGLLDVNGHGTHLAGTVIGQDVGGVRIGLLPGQDRFIAGKVLADNGMGLSEHAFAGLIWAADKGARAIGFALNVDTEKLVEQIMANGQPEPLARSAATSAQAETLSLFSALSKMMAARHADRGGVLIVAAAGNDSRRMIAPDFEAACTGLAADPAVLAVGAVQPSDLALRNAVFSNTAPDVVAPGVGIVSAAPDDGLRALNGTSMAMAHALVVSALWLDRCPRAEDAKAEMLKAATLNALYPGAAPYDFGAGLVQAP